MKYDFLVKEKIKNTCVDDPFGSSTCVNETNNEHIRKNDDYSYIGSTYEDFNIFFFLSGYEECCMLNRKIIINISLKEVPFLI